MKKILPFLVLLTFASIVYAQSYRWTKTYGDPSYSVIVGSTATDDWGNVYATGSYTGTVDLDPTSGNDFHTSNGFADIYVVKFDSAGNFRWAKTIGGTSAENGTTIAIDVSGNVLVSGDFRSPTDFDPGVGVDNHTPVSGFSSSFVMKLDSLGNFDWARTFGGTGVVQSASMALDAFGNSYSTGRYRGTADFDPGVGVDNHTVVSQDDIFVQKLDPSGNFQWAKTFGGAGNDGTSSICVSASGILYFVGTTSSSTMDFDPDAGIDVHNFTQGGGAFVEKFDAAGSFGWARTLDGSAPIYSVTTDVLENIYFAGTFLDTLDFDPGPGVNVVPPIGASDLFLEKLDANGNFVWVKNSGGTTSPYGTGAYAVKCDQFRNIYLTGYFGGTVDFDPSPSTTNLISLGEFDVFVEKFDSLGELLWVKSFGGTGIENGTSLAVNSSAHVYVGGSFKSNVDFNPDAGIDFVPYFAPNANAFLWRFDDCNATSGSFSMVSCDFYTSPSGNHTWTSTGTYNDTIPNAHGCDSLLTISLTIINVDSSVTLSSGTLSAVTNGATYQWINCDSSNAPIAGATNQSFHPLVTGNYAVVLTTGICSDTSACTNVIVVGVEQGVFAASIQLFPNPTHGAVTIDLGKTMLEVRLQIVDIAGNTLLSMHSENANSAVLQMADFPQGMYFVKIFSEGQEKVLKLVRI